jgi:hypothetical protein
LPQYLQSFVNFKDITTFILATFIIGYFSNPNILSMHRYYRAKISKAYLKGYDKKIYQYENFKAPYFLINATLNLQADKELKGVKNCDYFLFSPYFCGSKVTKYVKTNSPLYKKISLATAITVSGAAINPLMGYKTNRAVGFFLTLLNLRLGYWAINPKILNAKRALDKFALFMLYNKFKAIPTFWPFYNFSELFGKMNLNRWMINLADGGGIENLGAYELFRRNADIIICCDATQDSKYSFEDLRNLLLRVASELEIKIEFGKNQKIEDIIYPHPSSGYSKKNFAIAKYYKLPKSGTKKEFIGYFVYLKASITAPQVKLDKNVRKEDYYAYKNHHPLFPHEPTTDQFFDEHQWEAYRALGYEIADKLFKNLKKDPTIKDIKNYLNSLLAT